MQMILLFSVCVILGHCFHLLNFLPFLPTRNFVETCVCFWLCPSTYRAAVTLLVRNSFVCLLQETSLSAQQNIEINIMQNGDKRRVRTSQTSIQLSHENLAEEDLSLEHQVEYNVSLYQKAYVAGLVSTSSFLYDARNNIHFNKKICSLAAIASIAFN